MFRSKGNSKSERLRTGGKDHVQRSEIVTQEAELATETGGVLITNLDNRTRRLSSSHLLTEAVLLLQGVTTDTLAKRHSINSRETINATEPRALV